MSFAAVQKHVAVLERAGLLTKRRNGREQLASGDVAAVRSVACCSRSWNRSGAAGSPASTSSSQRPRSHSRPGGLNHARHRRQQDLDNRTLTITAEFAAPVERVWQVYADPRQLEKVWGPPTYPATVVDHDLTPGGRMTYFMTSPEGEKFAGYWEITAVDEPHGFAFVDGFADLDFNPNPDLPVSTNVYSFADARRRHPRDLRDHLRDRRGAAEGAGHGHGRGCPAAIDQIDDLVASS